MCVSESGYGEEEEEFTEGGEGGRDQGKICKVNTKGVLSRNNKNSSCAL